MKSFQEKLATIGGDVWSSFGMLALWPWPAVIWGTHGTPGSLFTEDDYRLFTRVLEPGDFIVTRSKGFILSNRAIPGAFKHLAVYVGPVSGKKVRETGFIQKPRWLENHHHTGRAPRVIHERSIVHAISEGVVCQDVLRLLAHADYAAILRPTSEPVFRKQIVNAAIERVGVEYNFDFTPNGPEASYCTELGQHCLKKAGLLPCPTAKIPVSLFGKKADVPLADLFTERLIMVACTESCNDPSFYRRSITGDKLRVAVAAAESPDDE